MARITHVASARKAQGACRKCGSDIKAGEPYKWFANRIGMIAMAADAYCDERIRLAALLREVAALADACNLWFNGQPAQRVFLELAGGLEEYVRKEEESEAT